MAGRRLITCACSISASPRRRELLHQIHVRHEALLFRGPGREDHDINEDVRPGEDAFTYVQRVAHAKAEGGIQRMHWRGLPPQLLLAADTTLELDGEIIGKPDNESHAMEILRRLSGRTHQVLTAVVLVAIVAPATGAPAAIGRWPSATAWW